MVQGIPESELASRLQEWEDNLESPLSIAYLPSPGLVKLRLTCRGKINSSSELLNKLDQESVKIRKILGDDIYAERLIGIEEVIADLMTKSNQTLTTAESFTGGSIAAKIISISGASKFFKGSIVAYSNEIKISELGVVKSDLLKLGAVSKAVAIQMSRGIKEKYNSDWSISTTGFAGNDPSGKFPVGTIWISISGPGVEWAKKFTMGSNRNRTISKSTLTALNQLRIFLKNQDLGS
jgi:nicotinamide-nucleotide amidase